MATIALALPQRMSCQRLRRFSPATNTVKMVPKRHIPSCSRPPRQPEKQRTVDLGRRTEHRLRPPGQRRRQQISNGYRHPTAIERQGPGAHKRYCSHRESSHKPENRRTHPRSTRLPQATLELGRQNHRLHRLVHHGTSNA